MPYYQDRQALHALASDVITPSALRRVLTTEVYGTSRQRPPVKYQMRRDPIEDYNGLYVAPHLKLNIGPHPGTLVYLCPMGAEVDFRVLDREREKALADTPFTLERTQKQFPIMPDDLLPEVESAFAKVSAYVEAHSTPPSQQDLLAEIHDHKGQYPDLLDDLIDSLNALRPIPDTVADTLRATYSDARAAALASGVLKDAVLGSVQRYSWKPTAYRLLRDTEHLDFLDWKADAKDVAWVLSNLAGTKVALDLNGTEQGAHAYAVASAGSLFDAGKTLAFLGDHGDTLCVSVLPRDTARDIAERFAMVLDDTDLVEVTVKKKPGLLGRLFGKKAP